MTGILEDLILSRDGGIVVRSARSFCRRTGLLAAMVALVLATGFFAQPASADSIVLTPSVTTATLTEGQSLLVTYTAAITVTISGVILVIDGESFDTEVNQSGDPTDIIALQTRTDNCLGFSFTSAGNGTTTNTCTIAITYVSGSGNDGEDLDSGTATARFSVEGGNATSNNANTLYTVNDVGTVVPEPSSLVLLGSGLLALAGALRRKLPR